MMLEMAKVVLQNRKGQGLVEYTLIIAAIAIAVIGSMDGVATAISTAFGNIATALQ
jgi:Flp pilus assembly pilin Flp